MTTIDPVALRGVLAHIETHPEEWDQKHWGKRNCRTSYCFAGWACVLTGVDEFKWDADGTTFDLDDESGDNIFDAARMILGLSWDQASRLFCGDNSLRYLRDQVDELCRGAES